MLNAVQLINAANFQPYHIWPCACILFSGREIKGKPLNKVLLTNLISVQTHMKSSNTEWIFTGSAPKSSKC